MKNLLTNVMLLLIGLAIGLFVIAIASSWAPKLFINLGLHGTILCIVSALVVAIPLIDRKVIYLNMDRFITVSAFMRVFAIGVAIRILMEIAFATLGAPNPEEMIWDGRVVIAGGQRTFDGWILLARGCVESGLVSVILFGSIIVVGLIRNQLLNATRNNTTEK